MKVPEYDRGFRDGMRFAVTWLHQQAREMNDPWAKTVLNTAAFGLGVEGKSGTLDVKAKLLETALDRAARSANQ